MDKHPAEYLLRYLLVSDPGVTDAQMMKKLSDWAFLQPSPTYWGFLRQRVAEGMPPVFTPLSRTDAASMKFLRKNEIYDMFFQSVAVQEAWDILADPMKRVCVEQGLMARVDPKILA